MLICCSEISILVTYVQLCKGDYNWWWKSFFVGGSVSIYFVFYAVYYHLFVLHMTRLSSIIIYYGIMSIFTSLVFLICGTAGTISTYIFLRQIYSMIKID
jgi:transmembrane 9 superfamily protein 2/4